MIYFCIPLVLPFDELMFLILMKYSLLMFYVVIVLYV
jgi:hypothetical protein